MSRKKRRRAELVELTSKPLKLQLALSGLLLLVGVVLLFAGAPGAGIVLAAIGFIWQTITRITIWWNHG
ncbi:MAG: hypothetical protein ACR2RV_09640 [Verrucomicrobiales bacterium]